jgi:hypothetical protein
MSHVAVYNTVTRPVIQSVVCFNYTGHKLNIRLGTRMNKSPDTIPFKECF